MSQYIRTRMSAVQGILSATAKQPDVYDKIQSTTVSRLKAFDHASTAAEVRRRLREVENGLRDHGSLNDK